VSRTYLSGVVVQELHAGARDAGAVRLVERVAGVLERAGRIVTPTFADWKEAGRLVARIARRDRGRGPRPRQILNESLLALSAKRIGAELFTFNRGDFELIRRHTGFALRVVEATS
jgi:predicted nucleic acid-binding protein